jgi:hypothetical protein
LKNATSSLSCSWRSFASFLSEARSHCEVATTVCCAAASPTNALTVSKLRTALPFSRRQFMSCR